MSKTNVQALETQTEELQQSTRVSLEEVVDIGPTLAVTVIGGIIITIVTGMRIIAVGGERSETKRKLEEVIQSQKSALDDYFFRLWLIRLSAYHKIKFYFSSKLRNIYHVILVGFSI